MIKKLAYIDQEKGRDYLKLYFSSPVTASELASIRDIIWLDDFDDSEVPHPYACRYLVASPEVNKRTIEFIESAGLVVDDEFVVKPKPITIGEVIDISKSGSYWVLSSDCEVRFVNFLKSFSVVSSDCSFEFCYSDVIRVLTGNRAKAYGLSHGEVSGLFLSPRKGAGGRPVVNGVEYGSETGVVYSFDMLVSNVSNAILRLAGVDHRLLDASLPAKRREQERIDKANNLKKRFESSDPVNYENGRGRKFTLTHDRIKSANGAYFYNCAVEIYTKPQKIRIGFSGCDSDSSREYAVCGDGERDYLSLCIQRLVPNWEHFDNTP